MRPRSPTPLLQLPSYTLDKELPSRQFTQSPQDAVLEEAWRRLRARVRAARHWH